MKIDLNCDMGESFGAYQMGADSEVIPYVTSVNIACGFHAGDPHIMARTVQLALANNIVIGAHPGLPDLNGFGRRNMAIAAQEAYELVLYQVGALGAFVQAKGARLHHVKPHGALYNMAAKNTALARAIAQAVADYDRELVLYGLSGSELIHQGQALGLTTASEVFADRTYQPDGSLTPRTQANALIEDDEKAVAQIMEMVQQQRVKAVDGQWVSLQADTICIHGDGSHAVSFARRVNQALTAIGALAH